MATQARDLALYEPQQSTGLSLVRPLVNAHDAHQAIEEYEALKAAIVQPGDVIEIQGRDFLRKSFWRRVAACFGLSLELVSEVRGFDEQKKLFYSVVYRAVAPNGRTMIADGYCSTAEQGRGAWPEHNVRATAHTRAKNRAISDLVGGGEVSADEVPDYVDAAPEPQRQAATVRHTPAVRPIREVSTHAPTPPPAESSEQVITMQMCFDHAKSRGIVGQAWTQLKRENDNNPWRIWDAIYDNPEEGIEPDAPEPDPDVQDAVAAFDAEFTDATDADATHEPEPQVTPADAVVYENDAWNGLVLRMVKLGINTVSQQENFVRHHTGKAGMSDLTATDYHKVERAVEEREANATATNGEHDLRKLGPKSNKGRS